jgi:hypothetical protein
MGCKTAQPASKEPTTSSTSMRDMSGSIAWLVGVVASLEEPRRPPRVQVEHVQISDEARAVIGVLALDRTGGTDGSGAMNLSGARGSSGNDLER